MKPDQLSFIKKNGRAIESSISIFKILHIADFSSFRFHSGAHPAPPPPSPASVMQDNSKPPLALMTYYSSAPVTKPPSCLPWIMAKAD